MSARLRKAMDEKEEGFTLIELLVVIIIIGILAAIAIPVFLSQRTKGYDAQAKSDLRNYATQEETYFVDNNAYGTGAAVVAANGTFRHTATLNSGFSSGGFCVVGNTTPGSANFYLYDSSQGGLQSGAANIFGTLAAAQALCKVVPAVVWDAAVVP